MDITKLNLTEVKKILLERVLVHGYLANAQGQMMFDIEPATTEHEMALKIDLLERLLELLRGEQKYFENELSFERFIQGSISIGKDGLHYTFPEDLELVGSGTPQINLQTKLLMFLLLHHRSAYQVFDIINNFIKTIGRELEPLDFKKTRTGVTRCFTNTRFAANSLRAYGLIKFTRKEAYKTWTLSLPGFLVASKVLSDNNWVLPKSEKIYGSDLHPDIHKAYIDLQTYDKFVERLASVCKNDVEVFETFGPILRRAYSLMGKYWHALRNENITLNERKKKSLKLLSKLENISDKQEKLNIEDFYKEFSACINVQNLLKSLSEQDQ